MIYVFEIYVKCIEHFKRQSSANERQYLQLKSSKERVLVQEETYNHAHWMIEMFLRFLGRNVIGGFWEQLKENIYFFYII